MHSWRELLLPFFVEDYFMKPYDLSQPWDGPKNRRWANEYGSLEFCQCPCRRHPKGSLTTDYVVVVGKNTMRALRSSATRAADRILWTALNGLTGFPKSLNSQRPVERTDSDGG
jgi:hypothetical protein